MCWATRPCIVGAAALPCPASPITHHARWHRVVPALPGQLPENVEQERRIPQSEMHSVERKERKRYTMDRSTFWHLIEASNKESNGDQEKQMVLLEDRLSLLPLEELQVFARIFDDLFRESYQAWLWNAAYLILGGCSDDGFDYFRGWLIAQGEAVFSNALVNPDSLADYLRAKCEDPLACIVECEEILSVARHVYEEKTGQEMPEWEHKAYPDIAQEDLREDGSFLKQRCPRLWTLFEWE